MYFRSSLPGFIVRSLILIFFLAHLFVIWRLIPSPSPEQFSLFRISESYRLLDPRFQMWLSFFSSLSVEPDIPGLQSVDYCMEKWPMEGGRTYYSVFTMIVQYAIPIIIVTVVRISSCLLCKTSSLCVCLWSEISEGIRVRTDQCEKPLRLSVLFIWTKIQRLICYAGTTGLYGDPEEVEASNGQIDSIYGSGFKEEEQQGTDTENECPPLIYCSHFRNLVASTQHPEHPEWCHEVEWLCNVSHSFCHLSHDRHVVRMFQSSPLWLVEREFS